MKFKRTKQRDRSRISRKTSITTEESEKILAKVQEYNIILGMSRYRLETKNRESLLTAYLRKELDKMNILSKNISIEISPRGSIVILTPEGFIQGEDNGK